MKVKFESQFGIEIRDSKFENGHRLNVAVVVIPTRFPSTSGNAIRNIFKKKRISRPQLQFFFLYPPFLMVLVDELLVATQAVLFVLCVGHLKEHFMPSR